MPAIVIEQIFSQRLIRDRLKFAIDTGVNPEARSEKYLSARTQVLDMDRLITGSLLFSVHNFFDCPCYLVGVVSWSPTLALAHYRDMHGFNVIARNTF